MQNSIVTPDILAERWCKTTRYLAQLRCNGKGPAYLKIGRKILYRLQDIESFEERRLRLHTAEDFLA
ncbi:MAG: DNA-binding protein [Alphaproteobacteria bacterium]|nr:DNA-binding protein [Alphaproteobacteria bacterium]NCQ67138.1 DNA-binding protein [Alphaproteobacteria bacterium]NCT07734.1 DNA-binding protein [Alphaproteobacteria bacterium]